MNKLKFSDDAKQRMSYTLLQAAVRAALAAKEIDADRTLICLILSTADLIEFNDLLVDIARDHAPIVMAFVPTVHLKAVVKLLNSLTEDYAKSSVARGTPQSFLAASFARISSDGVPLTVFNLMQ